MKSRRRSLTLQDVANRAGVSQATVSLVLNGVAGVRVSDQTRERVLEAAEELGYRRAVRVRADERYGAVIALVIDDIAASPFAVPLFEGAREAAWEHKCVVNVVSTRNDVALERAALQSLLAIPVIGIIYATLLKRDVTIAGIGKETPVILLNCHDSSGHYNTILPDDFSGARTATNALLAAGHTRIAHIAGETWLDAGRDRLAGYVEALNSKGIEADPALIQTRGSSISAARDATHALLDLPTPPSGIFCFNDRMALGAYAAAQERGLKVSSDLSIVGFDNDPFATSLFPLGLTTAELPHEAMARMAVDQIMQLQDPKVRLKPKRILVPCPLVRRNSISRPSPSLYDSRAQPL